VSPAVEGYFPAPAQPSPHSLRGKINSVKKRGLKEVFKVNENVPVIRKKNNKSFVLLHSITNKLVRLGKM
jgi:hypothetical protein